MRTKVLVLGGLVLIGLTVATWLWFPQGTTLVVDPAATPGAPNGPFPTIAAAIDRAKVLTAQGEPVTVRIAPGTYRESVTIDGSPDDAGLVIQGAGADQVVVSGADVFNDWAALPDDPDVLAHAWDENWGLAVLPTQGWEDYFADNDVSDLARRQEAVWVGDEIMRQVLTRDEVLADAGTFYVDEANDEILLHPAADLVPDSVAVAVREEGFTIRNRSRITVRGLTVERVATALQDSAIEVADSSQVTVDDVHALWNSWGGLALQKVDGAVVRNVSTSSNGVIGLSIYRTEDLEVIDVENSYNNTWRGVWARYLGWETGAKVFQARRIRFRNWVATGNAAVGLWLDTDVADVTIDGAVLANNLRDGLFLEAIQGPVLVRDTVICGNGEDGIVDGKADDVRVEGSRIFGNTEAQVLFSGEAGGRSFTTYDTATDMTIRSEGWTLHDNTIAAGDDTDLTKSNLDAADWEIVVDSLTSDQNRWSAPQPYEFHAAGDAHDIEGWRELTGQDLSSTFALQPPPEACPS